MLKLSHKKTQEGVRREENAVLAQKQSRKEDPSLAARSKAERSGAVDLGWTHSQHPSSCGWPLLARNIKS